MHLFLIFPCITNLSFCFFMNFSVISVRWKIIDFIFLNDFTKLIFFEASNLTLFNSPCNFYKTKNSIYINLQLKNLWKNIKKYWCHTKLQYIKYVDVLQHQFFLISENSTFTSKHKKIEISPVIDDITSFVTSVTCFFGSVCYLETK